MTDNEKELMVDKLLSHGVENIIPNKDELRKLLLSPKKLNIYMGIDPTATRIHLGHAVPLRKLQILASLGHKVTFLVGDFTARIGDTSDKDSERPVLSTEQIEENFKTYKRQAEKFLDFSKVELKFNSEWLGKLGFGDILKLADNFSLNDFIGRELIKKRLGEGRRVSLPEVLYPLMQGFDSLTLETDLQLGGTDQTFNMQAGRTLVKNKLGKESYILANGFLPGTDGRKMSKSWGNAIWIEDSAEEIFGKVMSIKDELIVEYFLMGTNVDESVIDEVKDRLSKGENPMNLKRELGRKMVEELCGASAVMAAEEYFQKTVVEKKVDEEAIEIRIPKEVVILDELIGLLIDAKQADSRGEVKRLIEQGGLYIDEERVTKDSESMSLREGAVIRLGKRRYLRVTR